MATNKILQAYAKQLCFRDVTDFSPTAANDLRIGTPTNVQMDLSVLANGAYWQSAKTATLEDSGSASGHWPIEWTLGAVVDNAATPAAGTNWTFWWSPSPSATAGTANGGGASGTDLTYTAAGTAQLILIGVMILRAVQRNVNLNVGTILLPHLYGSLICQNNSGVAMVSTTAAETHFTLTPRIAHIQAAA